MGYFKNLENKYRAQLSKNNPLVIRLDGKDITKNFEKYNLMDPDGFTYSLYDTAKNVCSAYHCRIYAVMDELSIIFLNPHEFFSKFTTVDSLRCGCVFLQDFIEYYWEHYEHVKFKISIFSIKYDVIESYINSREKTGENTSVFYFAKHFLDKDEYTNKKKEDIVSVIKKKNLYNKYLENPNFSAGYKDIIIPDSDIDPIDSIIF